jgi:hypothetical protein
MRIPLVATLLVGGLPALAQPVPDESRALFRERIACVEENITRYDDRISPADVVARALMRVCETLAGQDISGPLSVAAAIEDAAIVSVLRSRVRAQRAASSADERPRGSQPAASPPEERPRRLADERRLRRPTRQR